jgi:hypothetical protein
MANGAGHPLLPIRYSLFPWSLLAVSKSRESHGRVLDLRRRREAVADELAPFLKIR